VNRVTEQFFADVEGGGVTGPRERKVA
jgi:hypothetical protein